MLTPINTTVTCNGGFKWKDDLGFEVREFNFNVFLDKVKARLIARGLFVGAGWQDEVIDTMCRMSNCECVDKAVQLRPISWQDFENFGHFASNYVKSGGETVSQEEAERRASICLTCPRNKTLSGICYSCAGLLTWMVRLTGDLKTSKDQDLHQCECCGCQLRLAVHIPVEQMKDERFDPAIYPIHCWKTFLSLH